MPLLPIFLKLDGRPCLLVGAGKVALDKIRALLITGAHLRVVAPDALPEIRQLAAEGKLEWIKRDFVPADLDGNLLVIAATNSPDVNAAVYREAVRRGILANSVDDPPNCEFFFGSVVTRGPLQVAVSTAGQSPAFAQQLRREIEAQLPEEIGSWLENLGLLRREVLATQPPGEARKLILHELAKRPLCEAEDCPARRLAHANGEQEPENAIGPDSSEDDSENCYQSVSEFTVSGNDVAPATVALVGAGPGDPDLLTIQALRWIQTADVILHDDLVTQAILDLASPSAEIVNVGKRCGAKLVTQEEIHARMIESARMGRSVVRLKGGDPLLFGRAAEEIAALVEAGVPYEIVPGIPAGFAAAAALGCSLTDRAKASSVIFLTHHRAQNCAQPQPDSSPAPTRTEEATRVIYMPGRELRPLAEELLRQGLPPELPCAVVSCAARPGEQIYRATLATLGNKEAVAAPSLVLVGWALEPADR